MELILKNFKSYRNETKIIFSEKLNLFFGINGAGKSTLIEAFNVLFNTWKTIQYNEVANFENKNSKDSATSIILKSTISKSEFINGFIKKISTDLLNIYGYSEKIVLDKIEYFFNNTQEITESIEFLISLKIDKENKDMNIKFNIKESHSFDSNIEVFLDELHSLIPEQIYEYLYKLLYNFSGKSLDDFEYFQIYKVKKWKYDPKYLLAEEVLCKSEEDIIKNSTPLYNLISSYELEKNKEIFNNLSNIQSDISQKREESSLISRYINEKIYKIWPEFKKWNLEISIEIQDKSIITNIKNRNNHNFKPLSSESDGRKQFLSILFSLSLLNEENNIYLIDEPEVHLHPESIIQLKRELHNLSKNNYLFVTTHSMHMLERGENPFHITFNEEKLSSEVTICEFNKNNFYKILSEFFGSDTLGLKFLFSKKILFVEGISDMRILSVLFRYYKLDILVLPTLGGNAQSIIESYKNILPNDYFVENVNYLYDNDLGGKKNSGNIIEKQTLNKENLINIQSLNDEINEIEDFLSIIPENYELYKNKIINCKNDRQKKIQVKEEYTNILIEIIENNWENEIFLKFIKKLKSKIGYEYE